MLLSYPLSKNTTLSLAILILFTSPAQASQALDLTQHWAGPLALFVFVAAYVLVALEHRIALHKSKPVLLAAGLIWLIIAFNYRDQLPEYFEHGISQPFLEYAELFFFLLVAMTYVNTMVERNVFAALRSWLLSRGYSYKNLFWLTGGMAFVLSPIADNLTTALVLCAVVLTVGEGQRGFVSVSCVNIVIGANAGGVFSPFGDITTLMVWQRGVVEFHQFFVLLIPAAVNFLLPALVMQFAVPKGRPAIKNDASKPKKGGLVIVGLFLLTIATAIFGHVALHIPPVFGMMLGLAYLEFYAFYLQRCTQGHRYDEIDVFDKIARAEWDTLLFFYGVIMSVGGLGFIGYLQMASGFLYGELGPTAANSLVGIMSALVDNIPMMYAVLTMNPDMPLSQWLLVTLAAGVGGSLLSIGSAAGVALMGQARGQYTFMSHLKWTPIIALAYIASIATHLLLNTTIS